MKLLGNFEERAKIRCNQNSIFHCRWTVDREKEYEYGTLGDNLGAILLKKGRTKPKILKIHKIDPPIVSDITAICAQCYFRQHSNPRSPYELPELYKSGLPFRQLISPIRFPKHFVAWVLVDLYRWSLSRWFRLWFNSFGHITTLGSWITKDKGLFFGKLRQTDAKRITGQCKSVTFKKRNELLSSESDWNRGA